VCLADIWEAGLEKIESPNTEDPNIKLHSGNTLYTYIDINILKEEKSRKT